MMRCQMTHKDGIEAVMKIAEEATKAYYDMRGLTCFNFLQSLMYGQPVNLLPMVDFDNEMKMALLTTFEEYLQQRLTRDDIRSIYAEFFPESDK